MDDGPDGACQWFHQRPCDQGELVGQGITLAGRHCNILRKPSRTMGTDELALPTEIWSARPASVASATGNQRIERNPSPDPSCLACGKRFPSPLHPLSGALVPHDEGRHS